jgi:hypothetical protein
LEWISPPGRRGEEDVDIEDGGKGPRLFLVQPGIHEDFAPIFRHGISIQPASPKRIRSSRRACASCARASKAVRLRAAGNCRTMEITCSSFNSKTLMVLNTGPEIPGIQSIFPSLTPRSPARTFESGGSTALTLRSLLSYLDWIYWKKLAIDADSLKITSARFGACSLASLAQW